VLLIPRRERVVAGGDRVFAADLSVDAVRDAFPATDIPQDLGGALVGLALRVKAGAGTVGPWLADDPVVAVLDYVTLLCHQDSSRSNERMFVR
jgi:hypothetical protein